MSSERSPPEFRRESYRPLLFLALIVLLLWAASGLLLYGHPDRGTIGDMFGAVNALFSGLAFAGVVYAIFLQRRELELQREELRATRVELSRSAEAQEKSERALVQQVEAAEFGHRLAALNNMLEFTRTCHERLKHEPMGEPEKQECIRWSGRRLELMGELDLAYRKLVVERATI
jgi:hypothetical protein